MTPDTTPSANKTSEAVVYMGHGSISALAERGVRVAIATKYQRMEETLRNLERSTKLCWCDDDLTCCICQCSEALAFDPLSQ